MSDELKPCPWCGLGDHVGTQTIINQIGITFYEVCCDECGRSVIGDDCTEQSAIAAWNALPRANDGSLRRALDLLGVPAQATKDPDKAPPLRVSVMLAKKAMDVVNDA